MGNARCVCVLDPTSVTKETHKSNLLLESFASFLLKKSKESIIERMLPKM